jgi:hypothetical protein
MGVIENKKNIFTTIGAYTSLNQEKKTPDSNNTLSSLNNKDEVLPFLLDMLKVVVGGDGLKELTGKLFIEITDTIEPISKDFLKNQLNQYNFEDSLPDDFDVVGIDISATDIDIFGKYKNTPSSDIGDLLYGDTQHTFDKQMSEAIRLDGTEITYNKINITFDTTTESFNFKGDTNTNVGDFFYEIIDETTFIDKKEFTSSLLDQIFGNVTKKTNRTIEEIYNDEYIKTVIENLISNDNITISEEESSELYKRADEYQRGVLSYDFGCGFVETSLDFDDFNTLVNDIIALDDPFMISNLLEDAIDLAGVTNDVVQENKETIRDNFFSRLIKLIKSVLINKLFTSPIVRFIMIIYEKITTGTYKKFNIKEFIQNNINFIICLIKEISKKINEFIYNIVLTFLEKIIKPIIKKMVVEKINNYTNIMKSLVGLKI